MAWAPRYLIEIPLIVGLSRFRTLRIALYYTSKPCGSQPALHVKGGPSAGAVRPTVHFPVNAMQEISLAGNDLRRIPLGTGA